MTSRLILSLTLTQNGRGGVGECLRGVLWIWSAKSARCTVKMVDEEWPVGGGNVGCSVECDMKCTMVTSGGGI